ncbi:MAG: hypothetical protein ABIP94_24825 [Planctomycetota bacterium]
MTPFPIHPRHLDHIRRHLAVLIARIEDDCITANDPELRRRLEGTSAFAHDLLDKVSLAEQAVAGHGDVVEVLARLDERLRQSHARIDAMHDQLEHIGTPKRPNPHEQPKGSGSTIGDAVRDSFLNMGE